MKPTVGRIVHYHNEDADGFLELYAAIVTKVINFETYVHLCVLDYNGLAFVQNVRYSEQPEMGCWSCPPREP